MAEAVSIMHRELQEESKNLRKIIESETKRLENEIKSVALNETEVAVKFENVSVRLKALEVMLSRIEEKLEDRYITRLEFEPVKKLVYGAVGTSLGALILTLIGLITIKAA